MSSEIVPAVGWAIALCICGVQLSLRWEWLHGKLGVGSYYYWWRMRGLGNWLGFIAVISIYYGLPAITWNEWLWWHSAPEWHPPRRESLYEVTGELRLASAEYNINQPGMQVVVFCADYVYRRRRKLECLPDNINEYVGKQVTVLQTRPPGKGRFTGVIYEMTSERKVLVNYDEVVNRKRARFKYKASETASMPALVTLLFFVPFFVTVAIRPRLKEEISSAG